MKLGLVTYQVGAEWDLATLIANCRETGFAGVELRATHAHAVEESLSPTERDTVKRTFADSGIVCYGVGSTYEFHSPDAGELRANIEGAKRSVQLASDIGAEGVKVRPNALPEGVSEDKTLEQIGRSLRDVAVVAADLGVKVWIEVHGRDTQRPDRMASIMQIADHPNAKVTWNCNGGEVDESGSIRSNFDLLAEHIGCVHLHSLWEDGYPYEELFALLEGIAFSGWTSWEGQGGSDPILAMQCYRKIWGLLVTGAKGGKST